MAVLLFCMFVMFSFPLLGVATGDCKPTRCSKKGPKIRFPFRHKHLQEQHCGYPGFELYCNNNNETVLNLPVSVEITIKEIDYVSQKLIFYDSGRCLPRKLQNLNLSASPFHFPDRVTNYSLFNCSSDLRRDLNGMVACLGSPGYQIHAVDSGLLSGLFGGPYSYSASLSSCTKILEILSVPLGIFKTDDQQLDWYEPACDQCEARGRSCRLSNKTGGNQIECGKKHKRTLGPSTGPQIIGAALGLLVLVTALAGTLFCFYCSIRTNKENQLRIEKFLEDYRALKPTRFTYADLRRITNHFDEKIGDGSYGTVYKGTMSDEINVAVKVLGNMKGNGEEFINEVTIIGRIHHVNVVRLLGFCAEGITRALVYEFLQNGSLDKFIFDNVAKRIPTEKLQDIAIGISKGIEYLHQGCDQQILHFDIKPQNILLDHDFNPKIGDFGLAKLCSKEQSAVSITSGRGTIGYAAPEVVSRAFGRVSYKSDIYSFGMVLLEMVGGVIKYEDLDKDSMQEHFPLWIYNYLNQKEATVQTTHGDEEYKITRKLTVAGLWCIQWCPADRPSMKAVLQMLEGDGDNLTMPPNPFPGTNVAKPNARSQGIHRPAE